MQQQRVDTLQTFLNHIAAKEERVPQRCTAVMHTGLLLAPVTQKRHAPAPV